jgi:hypothetical protein
MADAAPESVPRKHGLGRLGFRPARKGLPLCAGWTGTGERREIARSQVPGRADQGS